MVRLSVLLGGLLLSLFVVGTALAIEPPCVGRLTADAETPSPNVPDGYAGGGNVTVSIVVPVGPGDAETHIT